MQGIDAQYSSSQILRAIHHDQLYLFLGAAFVTVGIVSAAFSLLRCKLDPLLLWLALWPSFTAAAFGSVPTWWSSNCPLGRI